MVINQKITFVHLRYFLGGRRPSETTNYALSSYINVGKLKRYYFKSAYIINLR